MNGKTHIACLDEDIIIEALNINKTVAIGMGGDMAGIALYRVLLLAGKREGLGLLKMSFVGGSIRARYAVTAVGVL